jgi:hypothetical protein
MLGSNTGLLRLLLWQSDALTPGLDLISLNLAWNSFSLNPSGNTKINAFWYADFYVWISWPVNLKLMRFSLSMVPFGFLISALHFGLTFRKKGFPGLECEKSSFPIPSARNYRPCFRENQPKRSFSIKWKRAFWACFRENWVYKFGHSRRTCKKSLSTYLLTIDLWSNWKTLFPCRLRKF